MRQVKCPECGGRGEITRRVPRGAIAFQNNPEDWIAETKTCWRCKGDGIGRALCSSAGGGGAELGEKERGTKSATQTANDPSREIRPRFQIAAEPPPDHGEHDDSDATAGAILAERGRGNFP